MYPVKENNNCKNWDEIGSTIPAVIVTSATADVVTITANTTASMGEIAQDEKVNKSAKTQRRDVINYLALLKEVQDQFLACV